MWTTRNGGSVTDAQQNVRILGGLQMFDRNQCKRLKYRLFSILGRQEKKNTILIADRHVLKYKRKTIGDSSI